MSIEAESVLEEKLVQQLVQLGYKKVSISNEAELLGNFHKQLEIHNEKAISQGEFQQILNAINKGNVFERAKILRDRVDYITDSGDNSTVELINQIHWCQNQFQVAQQIEMEGSYLNRYDVTILINGLPLAQIELKRRGIELKEAFNQIHRYTRHSYSAGAGLFQYIQIFIISNGVNTKYYANTSHIKEQSFKQTFYWSDDRNHLITQLSEFADIFLEPCHLAKMITKYVVLNESHKTLMVLRPYQFYAVEAIVERVKNTRKPGYIWHTTGSGKTLTSYKAAQILTSLPKIHKVLFVVDRKDLDYQTTKEFNSFSKGSIDGTNNTKSLVSQLSGDTKLIVTTIQKLNNAVTRERFSGKLQDLQDKRVVIIFDECHRTQFGKTHDAIKKFFNKSQMFGFTGTPIFPQNAGTNEYGTRTTETLFGECLHTYVITDAIRDENVLKFSIDYMSSCKQKADIKDADVEAINEKEVLESPVRLESITNFIIQNHDKKTHNKQFTAMFCVSSVPVLIEYYNLFKKKKEQGEHNLKIATIFSYQPNEDDKSAVGFMPDMEFDSDDAWGAPMAADPTPLYDTQHSRDILEEIIGDYNKTFGTNYTTKDGNSFYNYYNNISKRVKNKEIDILLVVNMFLTGFDSKLLNTLYVDKNLRYHGLIQAFSRTNRITDEKKSQGNIVCFRNLKDATDEAVELFSSEEGKEAIFIEPYETYVERFNKRCDDLPILIKGVDAVNDLLTEEQELEFVQMFRDLMRLRNTLITFSQFSYDDLGISEQDFEDYKSKYLDLYDKARHHQEKEKVSILNDIDFELELIHRDEINVTYILNLLGRLKDAPQKEHDTQQNKIVDMLNKDVQLRSKRVLIEKFIQSHLPYIEDSDDITDAFYKFWNDEREIALKTLCIEEQLDLIPLQKLIENYLFHQKEPRGTEIVGAMTKTPKLSERKATCKRIMQKIQDFIETYISGLEG